MAWYRLPDVHKARSVDAYSAASHVPQPHAAGWQVVKRPGIIDFLLFCCTYILMYVLIGALCSDEIKVLQPVSCFVEQARAPDPSPPSMLSTPRPIHVVQLKQPN